MKVEIEIKNEQLLNVLSSAHFGHWGRWKENVTEKKIVALLSDKRGTVSVIEEEESPEVEHTLTQDKLYRAVAIVAKKYPHKFDELLSDSHSDMYTGDLLIQCALFGEEKYA